MFNQRRNSTDSRGRGARGNSRGRGARGSSPPHPYRGGFHGDSRNPVYPDLRAELDQEKQEKASLKQQNQDLAGKIEQLDKQVAEEADNYRSENNQKELVRSELKELESKYKNTIEGYNEGWEKLTNEKKELEVALKKASESSSSSSEEYHLLEASHDIALKELDAVQVKCANLESTALAQNKQIQQAEQACQDRDSELDERAAENTQLKEQNDQQQQEIRRLHSQVEKGNDEVTGLQQPQNRDSPASQTLTVTGTNADEQAAVNSLIDEVASQVGKWHSDLETPKAAVEAQAPGNDIKQFRPQAGKVSEAAISQDDALNDDEISAASMEVYSKLVRRSKTRNKANLEACIRICNHLNVSPGRLRHLLEKQVPDYDHELDAEELLAKLKRLHAEDAATMQSARGILKNAGVTEATLRAVPGSLRENELQGVVDTLLLKWQAKGASASHTGSRGAGSKPQPAQYDSTDAEAQTDASPDTSHAAIQTDPVESTAYGDVGVQHFSGPIDPIIKIDPAVEKRPNYLDSVVQTDPGDSKEPDNVPDYTNKGTQTQRHLRPNRFILTSLFLLFLLLCGGFLAWAISSQLDAVRERAMWLDANDMSRRATIYFTDASAHGRRLGWLWRPSALAHIEKPYHYAESMVGFGVHVQ